MTTKYISLQPGKKVFVSVPPEEQGFVKAGDGLVELSSIQSQLKETTRKQRIANILEYLQRRGLAELAESELVNVPRLEFEVIMPHPPWYMGFVQHTHISVTSQCSRSNALGSIIFGHNSIHGCAREMRVRFPSGGEEFVYHIATNVTNRVNQPSAQELNIIFQQLTTTGIDVDPIIYEFIQQGSGDNLGRPVTSYGDVVVWNRDIWEGCYEDLTRYNRLFDLNPDEFLSGFPPNAMGLFGDFFDSIAFKAHDQGDGLSLPITIYRIEIVLNNITIFDYDALGNSSLDPIVLLPRDNIPPVSFKDGIRRYRLNTLLPRFYEPSTSNNSDHAIRPEILVGQAYASPIVQSFVKELGCSWLPKYGDEWFNFQNFPPYRGGPRNWSSEGSIYFLLKVAAEHDFISRDVINAIVRREEVTWPRTYGYGDLMDEYHDLDRYISPRTLRWDRLGQFVLPGFPAYTNGNPDAEPGEAGPMHMGIFLYWLKPPHVPIVSFPGHPYNDPYNEDTSLPFAKFGDQMASYFDPNASVNRFLTIGANQGGNIGRTVSYAVFNIVRVNDIFSHRLWFQQARNNPYRRTLIWAEYRQSDEYNREDGFAMPFGPPLEPHLRRR
ncbi:hypothetical protein K8I61_02175 [bacterium]|nr:hypothetical protein [bacterium]